MRINVWVNSQQQALLEKMMATGLYGGTKSEVIQHLMNVGLQEFAKLERSLEKKGK